MHAVPTKRLLVYIVTGIVVLVVGTLGLLSMRGGSASSDDGAGAGLVIAAGDAVHGFAGASAGSGVAGASGSGETADPAGAGDAVQRVSTTTTQVARIWVQVAGAVRRPGVYRMAPGARVFEAVLEAGGFTDEADQEAIALAAQLSDGCRVYVPRVGELPEGTVQTPTASSAGIMGGTSSGGASGGSPTGTVLLNSATLEELDALPGIGPAIAQQIIAYRETQGPFTSIDQLTDVPGIGPSKLEQLRPLVGL